MLAQFTTENFKSFQKRATLSFLANERKEHEQSLLMDTADKRRFLPVAAIYGQNGGGKSNLLQALKFLVDLVLSPCIRGNKEVEFCANDADQEKSRCLYDASYDLLRLPKTQFHFWGDSMNLPTQWRLLLREKGREYRYELQVRQGKIIEENLYLNDMIKKKRSILFERSEQDYYLDDLFCQNERFPLFPAVPLLSLLFLHISCFCPEQRQALDDVWQWFQRVDYREQYANNVLGKRQNRKKLEIMVLKMLAENGIPICGFEVTPSVDDRHRVYIKRMVGKQKVLLSFDEESAGMQAFLRLLFQVAEALQSGGLLVVDNAEEKIHPQLFHYIVGLFCQPQWNTSGAQFLFTTHEVSLLNEKFLRPDEIWFCAMNEKFSSKLYSLKEFAQSDRSCSGTEKSWEELYLQGFLGAIHL